MFNEKALIPAFENQGFFVRKSSQFHWENQNFSSFDDFLGSLTSRKRKNIKRERKRVTEANIEFKWYQGASLTEDIILTMFGFYQMTIYRYGAQQYLNKALFKHLVETMPKNTAVLLAYDEEKPIAGGLFFQDDKTLFGRYWGSTEDYHSLHFETCYYQAIEYCIEHDLQRFEAGAQGEHKLSRGLLPQTTYSLHWISDKRFDDAVRNYVTEESNQINRYQTLLNNYSPYKEL